MNVLESLLATGLLTIYFVCFIGLKSHMIILTEIRARQEVQKQRADELERGLAFLIEKVKECQ